MSWLGAMPEDEGACPMTRAVVSYPYWQSELGGRELAPAIKLVVDSELVEIGRLDKLLESIRWWLCITNDGFELTLEEIASVRARS